MEIYQWQIPYFFLKLTSRMNHCEAEIFEIFLWLVRLTAGGWVRED